MEICDGCGKAIENWEFKSIIEKDKILCGECALKGDE